MYTSSSVFRLNFVNTPKDFLLVDATKNRVDVRLRASGFQLLGFNVKSKKVDIDISNLQRSDNRSFIPAEVYRRQIEKQLSNSMTLLEMDDSPIYFDLRKLKSKKVLVKPTIKMNLPQNYLLDGELSITPESITLKGPANEIDTIEAARTGTLDLGNLRTDFSKEVMVKKSDKLVNTTYSATKVLIKGKVARFSEKIIKVPIKVVNLPSRTEIRTFPDQVSVLLKGKIELLKSIESADFQVVGDFEEIGGRSSNVLPIRIVESPKNLYSARLSESHVEFILNRIP
ncbi:CdaR family protein [Maribacter algicola]|uniref:CdaR family protein n=1 Tax=Meishania litoralis TaxID=3434685 RepID=A0ACC7LKV9_9FLAO